MPTSAELLPSIAPEIDASSSQAVALLALAELEVGSSLDATLRPYLVAYKAAHNITLANRAGASGAVDTLTEGELTIRYANQNMGSMCSTSYGQKYNELVKQLFPIAARTAVMPNGT